MSYQKAAPKRCSAWEPSKGADREAEITLAQFILGALGCVVTVGLLFGIPALMSLAYFAGWWG